MAALAAATYLYCKRILLSHDSMLEAALLVNLSCSAAEYCCKQIVLHVTYAGGTSACISQK